MSDLLSTLAELTRFGRALTGAVKRETVADCTIECLTRLFGQADCAVFLTTEVGSRALERVAVHGTTTPPADDPFLGEIHSAGRPVRHVTLPLLGAPLVAAGHTMGIIVLRSKNQTAFAAADEAVLAAAAAQAAIAFQNTRLVELISVGKQEWEQMVDAIKPAICILDERGEVRRANRAFAALVGFPITALSGRPWLMLLPPAWAEPVGQALAAPGGPGGEIRTGRNTWAVKAHQVTGHEAVVLIIDEITETKRLQEQLIQSEKLSAIGQLIAGVAHELNNPLASVLGFADFLGESKRMPGELAEPLRVIQQEANRAAGIVKNLLTFARRQEQERRPVLIGTVLQRTLALLNNQLIGLNVEPRLVVEADLPLVDGSPNQLQQVFLNLINNAAQAIATAGSAGTVVVRARPWLGGVAVDVIDNGPGIAPELQEHVFEPFFTTKPVGEGTGLGLAICQGIVREHNGRLTLQSEPGRGATFTVELPPARGTGQAEAPPADASHRAARVLVVDDEPHILHYMRATLEAWGHSVATATDGEEGLGRAITGQFDLIVTDVRMPRLGGREFYERLAASHPEIAARVIFATGDTVRDDTQAFLEHTGRPYLHKPFKLAELRTTIAAALQHP
jgi:two-component system NtrC family sensor kinase